MAIYLLNRLPHSSLKFEVPYHKLYNIPPDYTQLKPFGCCCFPWLRPYTSNKLEPRSTACVFLGYCANTKGYRCLDPSTQKVYISRHVKFVEHDFPYPHLLPSPPTCSSTISKASPHFVVPSAISSVTTSNSVPSSSIPSTPSQSSLLPVSSSTLPLASSSQHTSTHPSPVI